MIIGHGDVASALVDRGDLLFFASGVSNSRETRESEYKRELDLLDDQFNTNKRIVYFGSLSVFYSETRYTEHKLLMEWNVRRYFPRYTIIRLGNIAWGKNPNTIINALRAKVARGEELDIQDTHRYIVELDEFQHWVSMIPDWNCEMNITGQFLTVQEIVDKYVKK